jgi:inosine-uridine nucleoside N-ribohydrolase
MHARERIWALALCTATFVAATTYAAQVAPTAVAPQKIIIDTDIGGDIDDAFAVALALRSPEVTILGVSTASGDTEARAKILDRMLGESGRQDIPVTAGISTILPYGLPPVGLQRRFGERGRFVRATHPAAVEFIFEQIRQFPGQITLVTIGPLINVGALIDRDPESFRKLNRVVMMGGSIETGYDDSVKGPVPEYNVVVDIPSAQKLFQSGVPIYVMPLDSTIHLKLDEVKRTALFSQGTPLTDSLALLYLMWGSTTPTLFDAMPVGFVIDPRLCPVEPVRIVVDEKGVTRSEHGAPNAQVCLHSDPEVFFRFYMARFR